MSVAGGTFFRLVFALALCALAFPAGAHDATFPIAGKKLNVRTDGSKAERKFFFKAVGEDVIRIANHDPAADGASVVVVGLGGNGGSSGLIPLDAQHWSTIEDAGELLGYKYSDPTGGTAGVTKVVLKNGKLQLKAKGEQWKWKPAGKQKAVWVHFRFEEEEYCAEFAKKRGANVTKNEKNLFAASDADAPVECQPQVCGNGQLEEGEECDDGNLAQKDGCRNDCTIGECEGESFATTYEAVQNVIFDSPVYRCSNDACHGTAKEGGLDLRAEASYESLVGIASEANLDIDRVFPGEPSKSMLFEKLEAKQQDRPASHGSQMPVAAPALSFEHLEGMFEWIRGGAPRDISMLGTQDNFGTCLPPAEPLKIPVPDPPAAGTGIQIQQTPWRLPGQGGEEQGEDEICMATYYDVSALIPESAKIPCPDEFKLDPNDRICDNDAALACESDDDCSRDGLCIPRRNATNPGNECFAYHRQQLFQDPQSHHSIIHIYTGAYDQDGPFWGAWSSKTNVAGAPGDGEPCDPNEIDPALGFNPDCSGEAVSGIACSFYGPPDASNFGFGGGGGALPQFSGSQEPYYELELADTVYSVLPAKGIVVWNSHAFNLTQSDTTMNQYVNLDFAAPEDQINPALGIFDARWIFSQLTPPFEQQEICATTTLPQGARLFQLTSHTHRWGVRWRTWLPPQTPCRPACPPASGPFPIGCSEQGSYSPGDGVMIQDLPVCGAPPVDIPEYVSTEYSDPLQLGYDEPLVFNGEDIEDRTLLFCSLFDNGSTETSPSVKRYSTSPEPPLGGSALGIGGPCKLTERACMDGPNKGELCNGTVEATFCETEAGAGDGECDACPLRGGVTTEDEMFINLGTWYLPES